MSDYDVMEQYRAALETSRDADPTVVAEEVADATPEVFLRVALRQALRQHASTMAARQRHQLRGGFAPAMRQAARPEQKTKTKRGEMTRSPRWEAAVTNYHRVLRMRLPTSEGYVFLGDANRMQIRQQVVKRRAHAAANAASADWFERLDGLLGAHGVMYPRDLPTEVLDALSRDSAS